MSKSFAAALSLLVTQSLAARCKALVLSGGGNNGAWEAGVMWGLAHYGNPEDFHWDVLTGVSAGSINTAGSAGFSPEQVLEYTEWLSESWLNMTTDQVWAHREGSDWLFNQPSLLDLTPAHKTLKDILSVNSQYARHITITAADVNTGEYVEFTQDNTSYSELQEAAVSSSSIPIVFQPNHFQGRIFMDGGTVWDVNIASAVKQCNALGASNEEITVDIAVCLSKFSHGGPVTNSVEAFVQAKAMHWFYEGMNDISAEIRGSSGVNFRYYFQERIKTCANDHILNFDGDYTWCLQEAGRKDAQNALAMGQDHIQHKMRQWFDNKAIQAQYPYVYDYIVAKWI